MEAPADNEPDRVNVLDGAAADGENTRLPVADDGPDDGVSAMPQCTTQVAQAGRSRAPGEDHCRSKVHRRRDGGSRCVRGHTKHLTTALQNPSIR